MKLGKVNKLLESIFKRSSFNPPIIVEERLNVLFPEAVNIEWCQQKGEYEAIFFNKGVETIAWFSQNGSLHKTRTNMTKEDLPSKVFETVANMGEIMNVVQVVTDKNTQYEVILRTSATDRFVVVCNTNGEIITTDNKFV